MSTKTKINHPALSKINAAALLMLIVGVCNTAGWIPPEWRETALAAATLLGPVAVMTWRTWFTAPA